MNNTNIVGSTQGMSNLARAKFGPGMLLQHEDLEQLNTYTRDLSRLLFKSFFGCGVICGLKVSADLKCDKLAVTVEAGVALACSGDPIYVPKPQTVLTNEKFDPQTTRELWVVLCGTVKHCAPRTAICAADDDEAPAVPTRERDGFEIRVLMGERPGCVCGCTIPNSDTTQVKEIVQVRESDCNCVDPKLPCYKDHYAGICGCNCAECSDDDCNCILLARLEKSDNPQQPPWRADHRVRRFIRPVLMRDPAVVKTPNKDDSGKTQSGDSQQGIAQAQQNSVLKESAVKAGIEEPLRAKAQVQLLSQPDPQVELAEEPQPEAQKVKPVVAAPRAQLRSVKVTAKNKAGMRRR